MSQVLLAGLIDAVPMPLLFVGRDERMLAANDPAVRLLGPGLTGRHYLTVLRQPAVSGCIETALATGQPATGSYLLSLPGGGARFDVTAHPVTGDTVAGVLVAFEDTSHQIDAVQMRRDFVANVSHELRTPLTALMGFIDTLRGPARDDAAARERFLGIMAREAERMNRLVQDLLSLSRVEANERVRPTAPVDLKALLGSVRATLAPMAAGAGASLTLDVPAAVTIPGDADQLVQVFTNLIENAVKYGGKQVTVSLTRIDHDPGLRGPAVRVAVADDGEGIEARHIPRLTERFYRIDNHRSREMGGTGLGLAIVKHIVNRHRGRFRIESTRNDGSRFIVALPAH